MGVIVICAADGVEAGMSVVGHGAQVVDGNVAADHGVERGGESTGIGNRSVEVEVGYHKAGVDAGVGASCADNRHLSPHDLGEGILDDRLHAYGIGLRLPPVEGRAAVGQTHEIAGHQSFSR